MASTPTRHGEAGRNTRADSEGSAMWKEICESYEVSEQEVYKELEDVYRRLEI